jgi:hypothetical protein
MGRPWFVGVAALAALFFLPLELSGASAAAAGGSITISGSISGLSGGQVLVLSTKGNGWTGAVQGSSFSVVIPSSDRAELRDATVQVIAASGSYVGPVVLKKRSENAKQGNGSTKDKGKGNKKGKKENAVSCGKSAQPACVEDLVGLGSVRGSISLGQLVGEDPRGSLPTWFLASKASQIDPRDAILAATRSGRPYGAGNLGLVPGGIPTISTGKKTRIAGPIGGAPGSGTTPTSDATSASCPPTSDDATGTLPGKELDCSGVPNMINVNVTGNGVLNNVNTSAASMAASTINVGATIQDAQQNAVSYYAPGGLTPASLATFLDPQAPSPPPPAPQHQNPADFGFSVEPDQLFPGDTTGSDVTMSVDCGTLTWCTNATVFANNAVLLLSNSQPWAQTSPPYALTANPAIAKPTFQAIVVPPVGTNIPDEITPGQLIALNGTQTGGATAQTMMEIGPYFATTPYIAGGTFTLGTMKADSAGNPVSASSSGTVTLKVERPERLPLPGETTTSGLMDTSGLDYWVSISKPGTVGGLSANCPPAAYSNVSGATVATQPDEYGTYPLVDSTTQDFDPAETNNPGPIEFTVNLSACETNGTQQGGGSGYAWTPGQSYVVLVSAEGVIASAGRTSDQFQIVAP